MTAYMQCCCCGGLSVRAVTEKTLNGKAPIVVVGFLSKRALQLVQCRTCHTVQWEAVEPE